jgi:ligand-binding SRPBCC domain-containing protein
MSTSLMTRIPVEVTSPKSDVGRSEPTGQSSSPAKVGNLSHEDLVTIRRHPERAGGYLLETEQWFPRPRGEVFDFFADAGNLEMITPPFLHFQIVTPRPIELRAGALIDYRLSLHHVPIRWRTEISAWEPSTRFIDQQLRGPYRYWIHEHTFADKDGGTLVRDAVSYAVPGGRLINWLIVERDLKRIFGYRRQVLEQQLST